MANGIIWKGELENKSKDAAGNITAACNIVRDISKQKNRTAGKPPEC